MKATCKFNLNEIMHSLIPILICVLASSWVCSALLISSKVRTAVERPSWRRRCNMMKYAGQTPRADSYTSTPDVASEVDCEDLCEGDRKCGLYSWNSEGRECYLYQYTVKMWYDLGINTEDMWWSDTSSISGSKQCEMQAGSDGSEYSKSPEKRPTSGFFTKIYHYRPYAHLTAHQCQQLCSLFSRCESVLHQITSNGNSWCQLFDSASSEELQDCHPSILECSTYTKN